MIITRSPLRVSLGGGGTDLPSYYTEHGGFLIAGAIDKYVYINVHPRFADGFLLKYSQLEEVSSIDEIRHPIIRESLRAVGIQTRNLEITTVADIPAGTGLGSSGSFTTALLKGLHSFERRQLLPQDLARMACELEDHLLLFFTGFSRNAGDILEDQDKRTKQADAKMVDGLHYVKELGHRS